MGCGASKLDQQPTVSLCRERCDFLEKVLWFRLEFAESQLEYIHSLNSVGHSFHYLLLESSDSSPTLKVAEECEADFEDCPDNYQMTTPQMTVDSHGHSHPNSGSDSSVSHLQPHQVDQSLVRLHNIIDNFEANPSFLHMNHLKIRECSASVVCEGKPQAAESVLCFGTDEVLSNPSPKFESYNGLSTYPGSICGGYYGCQESPTLTKNTSILPCSNQPPSPPRASAWDFFNFFDATDMYNRTYLSSWKFISSNNVREAEGILESDDQVVHQSWDRSNGSSHHHTVKQVLPNKAEPDDPRGCNWTTTIDDGLEVLSSSLHEEIRGVSAELILNDVSMECEVDRNVGSANEKKINHYERAGPSDLFHLVLEITSQFEKASSSAGDVLHLLEPDVVSCHSRRHVSMRTSDVKHACLPTISNSVANSSPPPVGKIDNLSSVDEELAVTFNSLSSTLHKLYLLEKKLYTEVKAVEKLRISYEKNCKKLKRLEENGGEAHRVDATRTFITILSTKIEIAIQVVEKISFAINKCRDEELWAHLRELIKRLTAMWKTMLECHGAQGGATGEGRDIADIGGGIEPSEAYVVAVDGLVKWASAFSSWIAAQKGYVKALSNWVRRCIMYEEDGVASFSPGGMEAPAAFVLCNQWAHLMDRLSEKEVREAMCAFTVSVIRLCAGESHQRLVACKDLERRPQNSLREDVKISKEIMGLEKQIVGIGADGDIVDASHNLHAKMMRLFGAMERFMCHSVTAYEELLQLTNQIASSL